MLAPRRVSGLADYTEAQQAALAAWHGSIEATFQRFGFTRLTPRPLELRELLLSKGGIQKQVFGVSRLPDDSPTDLALPFDRTMPLAIWVAMNAKQIVFPYKRYEIGYSYRGERPQAGRFQAFYQADVDIVGLERLGPTADAECVAVIYHALADLGLGDYVLSLNHIRLARALAAAAGVAEGAIGEVFIALDKLGKMPREKVFEDVVKASGLAVAAASHLVERFDYAGDLGGWSPGAALGDDPAVREALDELAFVVDSLQQLGIPAEAISFAPHIVRGLDYYSGVVFETTLVGQEAFGSVASGGRYDDLVSTFGKVRCPGVGGSIGLTRLFDAACRSGLLPLERRSSAEVFVGFRTPELRAAAQALAHQIRSELGARVDLYATSGKVKKQLSYAGRKGMPIAAVVMDESSIVVKDLGAGEQEDLPSADAAVRRVRELLGEE